MEVWAKLLGVSCCEILRLGTAWLCLPVQVGLREMDTYQPKEASLL